MTEQSLSPDDFCVAEKISRATLYNLWSRGKGPRFYYVGKQRRISPESRAEWQKEREGNKGGADASAA